ncbi:alpha/beta fold hydrolase [Blastochloris viridis]|uniref:Poly-beta-hydroxyalkanoate depolymerase n=1 Tax=Blastochloris viridis TaxID=1079 RepID=A0A0H5BEQ0_BLAVI|nr:alpha/beta fold hydrolase [Blastochloris viridis]ALK07917.1 Alpha/beta hydrolase family protein [Blastochloris viridis]BAR98831.1 polyhydroxyalkanoic acid synthase [Blastochloris viridis]CUU43839.1 Poly-beta-hydroxyalkanoate depolymerase [Blastochloris viridis]
MRSDHPTLWTATPWEVAFIAAAAMTEAACGFSEQVAHLLSGAAAPSEPLAWTTPNRVRLDLATMRLRDFSTGTAGVATLIAAPFALHTAVIADLAPGHSLVERLLNEGVKRLAVTDWRSATPTMRDLSIDSYLAELNVAVDELGPPVDLIGLCQGGWLALVYAARFPAKVRALVLVAAPIDTERGDSALSALARATPLPVFQAAVERGGGRMSGETIRAAWPKTTEQACGQARRDLDLGPDDIGPRAEAALARYAAWDRCVVDLPGRYYLDIVAWLFQRNLRARGGFPALGRTIALADVRHPLALIAGGEDIVAPAEQVLAAAELVGAAPPAILTRLWPSSHVGLFVGARSLTEGWPEIARWLCAQRRRRVVVRGHASIRPLAGPAEVG